MCRQLSNYFNNTLSNFPLVLEKDLVRIIDRWKKAVDSNKDLGAVLTNLSKAFDCFPYDLLVSKLYAYRLSLPALKMIQDYPFNRKQRAKIGSSYSA